MSEHPIRLTVTDDRARMRLAVFFRFILVLPHFVVLFFWWLAVIVVAIVNWFATLFTGRSPDALHGFLARFVRYATHVTAYICLLADEYPLFSGRAGYPVDLEIDPPAPQSRWSTFLRPLLAIPALAVTSTLTAGGGGGGRSGNAGGALRWSASSAGSPRW